MTVTSGLRQFLLAMKRNEHIVTLSRDHHFGLLFCWKIRQGLKNRTETERLTRYVDYFWSNHLRDHFEQEETILFIPENDPNCLRAKEEHRSIEKLIGAIIAQNSGTEMLEELADKINVHIRFEERELFPYLESVLTPGQLENIGNELQKAHQESQTDNYEDEFWKIR